MASGLSPLIAFIVVSFAKYYQHILLGKWDNFITMSLM
jgi:hypothetical protein